MGIKVPPTLTCTALIFDGARRILLIRENYGERRYGPPAGAVEPAETPQEAVVREVFEETCVDVRVERLVALYHSRGRRQRWLTFAFRCEIERGTPTIPTTGEIAEIGWFDPSDLPEPLTHSARAIADGVVGEFGIVRDVFVDA